MSEQRLGHAAPLESNRVRLRSLLPGDFEWLYVVATSPWALYSWRLRGLVPSLEQFIRFLVDGTDENFLVTSTQTGEPLGLVQAFANDERNRVASLSVLMSEKAAARAWPLEAVFLLLDHLFTARDLRKVYIQVTDSSRERYASLEKRGILVEEGCLRRHEYEDGNYVDSHILALYRSTWDEVRGGIGY